eukprot:295877-Rhodomonas_salina.1
MCDSVSCTIARQGVKAFTSAFVKLGAISAEQDALQEILCTLYMKEVKIGKHKNAKWLGELVFQNQALYSYVAIKYHFESLADIISVNLASQLVTSLQTNTNVNINEVAQLFEKVIAPIAQAYTSVPDFVNYIKASLQYEVIRKHMDNTTGRGRALGKAYDKLRLHSARGQRLSLQQIVRAVPVKLAESHLKECTSPPAAKQAAVAKKTSANKAAESCAEDSAAGERTSAASKKPSKNSHKGKDAKIKELKAQLL